jgi:hypothetical protein
MVQMMLLETTHFLPTHFIPLRCLQHVSDPRVLVASEGYQVVITCNT